MGPPQWARLDSRTLWAVLATGALCYYVVEECLLDPASAKAAPPENALALCYERASTTVLHVLCMSLGGAIAATADAWDVRRTLPLLGCARDAYQCTRRVRMFSLTCTNV